MQLNQLTIEEIAATGGMGAVYKACWSSPTANVPLAVKFLLGSALASAPVAFWREARAAARLNHPNIVSLLDAGKTTVESGHPDFETGTPYLVMAWVDGTTTSDVPPTDWEQTSRVLREMLSALAHAHACNVLHRDIKPANIMRTHDGTTRLTDFGIGRLFDEVVVPTRRTIVGTAPYMAPEQAVGTWRDEGPWTDIYGLAATVWHFVTGQPLYAGDVKTVIMAQVRQPIPALYPRFDVPPELESWFRTALAKNPRHRFQSAPQALQQLRAIDHDETDVYPAVRAGEAQNPPIGIPATPLDERSESISLRSAGVGLFGLRTPPLVGREREKSALWSALRECAAAREARVVLLEGPAGVGKSALAEWTRRRVGEGDYAALLRSTHEPNVVGEVALSGTVARAMRLQGLKPDPAMVRIREHFEELGFDAHEELALEFAARQFPGTSDRRRLQQPAEWHAFLLEFAQRAGGGRPTVWVIEDVHLSSATLEFLKVAARAEFPLLIIATARTLPGDVGLVAHRMTLSPLAEHEMRQLVDAHLPLEPQLCESLLARSQGSPMFAMQLLGDWVDRELLKAGPMGYRADPTAVAQLPDNIHDVWRARTMSSLQGPDGLRALCLVAVMGEHVDRLEWAEASRRLGIEDPSAELERLGRAGLVMVGHHTLRLEHALLRESTLRDLQQPERYHRAVVDALSSAVPTPRRIERIARHLWAANDRHEAFSRLYDAIIAYRTQDEHDVIIFLVPLLREWARATGKTQSMKLAHGLTLLGAEFMRRDGAASGREAAEEAAAIVFARGDIEHVIAEADRLRCLAAISICLSKAARARAISLEEALPYYQWARRVAVAANDIGKVAFIASHEAAVLRELNLPEQARAVLEETVTRTISDDLPPRAAALVLQQHADLFALNDQFDAAINACEQALELAKQFGDLDYLGTIYERIADLNLATGNLASARRNYACAHQQFQRRKAWNAPILGVVLLALDAAQGEPVPHLPPHFLSQFDTERLASFRGVALAMAALVEARHHRFGRASMIYADALKDFSKWSIKPLAIVSALLAAYPGEVGTNARRFLDRHGGALHPAALTALRTSAGAGAFA